MVSKVSPIAENLKKIRENIQKYSKEPGKVRVLGVTKFQPLERITEAMDLGVHLMGVNYVQEGQKLREALKDRSVEWHFIGHIQSRKAKQLLDYSCIQSLDRLEVADELNRRLG
ncbi:YggS family pyridoxal phosphate-dependent enzyme, partial [bacterium]|nr:YggS family pyridoxal phosphate-dependent enzyme [bacterium]